MITSQGERANNLMHVRWRHQKTNTASVAAVLRWWVEVHAPADSDEHHVTCALSKVSDLCFVVHPTLCCLVGTSGSRTGAAGGAAGRTGVPLASGLRPHCCRRREWLGGAAVISPVL